MTHFTFAARPHVRNAVLCALATLILAACGGGDGSSSDAAASSASDPVASLVSSSVGTIDRSQGTDTATAATPATNTGAASSPISVASNSAAVSTTTDVALSAVSAATTPSTTTAPATTPASGTTVASSTKSTTPVKTTTGVATLDWMPPTQNSDGSVLTNLAGYTVYYGTSPGSLTQSVKITNPGLTAFTVTDLPSGTWYFAVTAYSSTGVESSRTGTVSTTI